MKKVMERLKEKGIRLTPQRLAVIEFLKDNKNHPCVDMIYRAIKKKYPSISQATVYSTLQLLVKLGEIQELHIRGERTCYDPITTPHHHFLCRVCGKIYDVDIQSCKVSNSKNVSGHKIEEVQLYIYGICKNCLKKEER
jgi:Fur family peroxide stress response transcriptional regulator